MHPYYVMCINKIKPYIYPQPLTLMCVCVCMTICLFLCWMQLQSKYTVPGVSLLLRKAGCRKCVLIICDQLKKKNERCVLFLFFNSRLVTEITFCFCVLIVDDNRSSCDKEKMLICSDVFTLVAIWLYWLCFMPNSSIIIYNEN